MARKPRPVTDAERERVREMHTAGKGRNEIAETLGRSAGTITNLAREMDLSFDRSATAAATEAKKIDAKARRIAIIERTYARIERLHNRLDTADAGAFKFTTSTVNGIETKALDHVPGQEEKAFAGAITQYLNQVARLEAVDGDPGVDAARSMLGSLAEGLNRLAGLDGGGDDSGEG